MKMDAASAEVHQLCICGNGLSNFGALFCSSAQYFCVDTENSGF
jgi:hypothetical protein